MGGEGCRGEGGRKLFAKKGQSSLGSVCVGVLATALPMATLSVPDPDLEPKGVGGIDLLALLAFFSSAISSFFYPK